MSVAPSTSTSEAWQRPVSLLALAAFASSVSMRMCDPLLPQFAREFQVDLSTAAGTITGFALAYGLLQLLIGPLADRWGKYRLITWATALAGMAALACALAPGLHSLVLARMLAGGVGGAIIPVALAWVGDEVAYAVRQPVLARVMSGGLLGLVCGQLLSGALADAVGWRWAFVAVALLFGVVAVAMHRSAWAARSVRGGAAAAVHQVTSLREGWRAYGQIARPPWVRRVLATAWLEGLLFYGALAFVPSALHERLGLPLWQAALASAVVGGGGFAYTLLARRGLARLGEQGLALLGAALVAMGLMAVAWSPWLAGVVLGCAVLGWGFYAFHNTLQVHGTQLAPTQRGMGMALFALTLFLGQAVGVAVSGMVVGVLGFAVAFSLAGLAFFGLALAFVRAQAAHSGRADNPSLDNP